MNQFGQRWRGSAIVLCYHSVQPDNVVKHYRGPYADLAMSEILFDQHLAYITKHYNVVSIDDLILHIEEPSDKFVVAITFDDGYKDNLINVLPILEQYSVPATFYINTCFPEGDTWIWRFELWDHIQSVDYVEFNFQSKILKWNTKSIKEKNNCYCQIEKWIKNLNYDNQKQLIKSITNSLSRKKYPELCLTWDEIKILDGNKLVTIGAHTHTHPNLRILDDKEALFEINNSKCLLEEHLKHDINHFAYPYGTVNEAGKKEFELVEQLGFQTAFTTRFDPIVSPDFHSIPRLGIEHFLTTKGLKSKLSGWEFFARRIIKTFEN